MQPGPPHPPQQPGGQPPYQAQPPIGPPPIGPPPMGPPPIGPPPMGQPPMGQQPYGAPYPGQPYGAFPGQQPPPPRKPKTGLIVLIVVVALVVVGGGVTALILLTGGSTAPSKASGHTTAPSAPDTGRYQRPVSCTKLNGGPFTFKPSPVTHVSTWNVTEACQGTGSGGTALAATIQVMTGSDGVANAKRVAAADDGQQVSGSGFENTPTMSFFDDSCTVSYARSNEYVTLQFMSIPGATDVPSCTSAVMPYAKQYYTMIG